MKPSPLFICESIVSPPGAVVGFCKNATIFPRRKPERPFCIRRTLRATDVPVPTYFSPAESRPAASFRRTEKQKTREIAVRRIIFSAHVHVDPFYSY